MHPTIFWLIFYSLLTGISLAELVRSLIAKQHFRVMLYVVCGAVFLNQMVSLGMELSGLLERL